MVKNIVFILLCVFNSFLLYANRNNINYSFQYYTTDNGLSHNMVDCLLKDSRGFLWVGTWEGLNRFDGYSFKTFYYEKNSENSINGNFIYALCEDEYGNIWIGTDNGINVYLYEQDCFLNVDIKIDNMLNNHVTSIVKDHNGDLWIGGDQFIIKISVDRSGKILNIKNFNNVQKALENENNELNCIFIDKDENIWLGTNIGLYHTNISADRLERYMFEPNNSNSLPHNEVLSIYQGSNGDMWFGTVAGMSRFNISTNIFHNFFLLGEDNPIIPHDNITAFIEDDRGFLVVGTLGGLSLVNTQTFECQIISDVQFSKYGLNNSFVNCLLNDSDGNIWVGTDRGGLNRFNTRQKGFDIIFNMPGSTSSLNTKIVNSIFEDDNNLWIGTAGGGLNRMIKETGEFKYYTSSAINNSVPNNFISALYADRDRNIWVATWGDGMGILSPENYDTGNFKILKHSSNNQNTIVSDFISSFAEDKLGRVWMGTLHGIDVIDSESMNVTHFNATWKGIPIVGVGALLFDQFDNLWIATQKALFKVDADEYGVINPDTCVIHRIVNEPDNNNSLSGNYAISLMEDKDGNIWIGTYSEGINKITKDDVLKNNFIFERYSKKNGLSSNIAYAMQQDANGYIWISTDNGLSRLNSLRGMFRNYYLSDGLLSNQFYWGASYKNKQGRIYFGSMNGLVSFLPAEVYENMRPLEVHFTDFTLDNKSVVVNQQYYGNTVLSQNIESADRIFIPYQAKEFAIEFSSLNYFQPEKNHYSYKLEPFDAEWVLLDNMQRKASYMNLKSGNYKLMVKVSSNDLIFNDDIRVLEIVVDAPFYNKLYFQIIMALVIVLLIMLFIRMRTIKLKEKNNHLEELVVARTLKIEEQNEELRIQTEYLQENNTLLEERQELIEIQKKEIENHNNKLEELVRKRTAELVKAKDKAEESDRLKTAFLANMSHEIRTPMNAIVGFSSLLNDSDLTNDERANLISMINSSSESLLHLIDDILDLSMIESNQLKIKFDFCQLDSLVDNVHSAMMLINRNPDLDIRLNNTLKDCNIELNSDVYRIKQVLLNLMNNALKFTDQGYIELGVLKNNEYISFYVKDTGRGISPEELEVIFERFRKIEDDKNKLYRGAGLGLSISKRLSELLGGRLRVESNKDAGSTFYFELPIDFIRYSSHDDDDINKNESNQNLNGKTVLIVEDEYSNYLYLQKALASRKLNTIWAKDGEEAIIEIKKNSNIDLVLMDINMPKLNGIDAFNAIRRIKSNIVIVAQTAFARYEDESRIRAVGFDDFIGKPIKLKDLYYIVDKFLSD
ncbi:MAG: response regulator [Marinilabiliaceae bacterium]|nr:response regulator [Marinilabiliaceae bacterium]